MIVRCVSELPSEKQIKDLGLNDLARDNFRRLSFGLEAGEDYLVLGMAFYVHDKWWGTGAYVEYFNEMAEGRLGYMLSAPLCLFDIVDGRASRYWEARRDDSNVLSLRPRSFYQQYYNDDLSECVPEVVEGFRHVYALLESEQDCPG